MLIWLVLGTFILLVKKISRVHHQLPANQHPGNSDPPGGNIYPKNINREQNNDGDQGEEVKE